MNSIIASVKRSHWIALFLVPLLLQTSCREEPDLSRAVNLTDSLRKIYAPDSRTTDFHIHFEENHQGALVVNGETSSRRLGEELMSILNTQYKQIVDSFTVLPEEAYSNRPYGLVRIGVAPIREEPVYSSQQVTQAVLGMPIRYLKSKDGWYRVQLPDDYIGWIDSNSVVMMSREGHQSWMRANRWLTTALHPSVYSSPSTDSSRIAQLSAGSILTLISKREGWNRVRLPDRRMGWIQSDQGISFEEWVQRAHHSTPDQWIESATDLSGLSYLWGGTSAYGVDCSGFTKIALYLNGLIIPRDASQQVEAGIPLELQPESNIDWNQYRTGDMFFFGTEREDGSHRITHVAFHTKKGQVLHSTTWVREESLNRMDTNYNDYRRNTLLEARRFDVENKASKKIVPVSQHPWYFPVTHRPANR